MNDCLPLFSQACVNAQGKSYFEAQCLSTLNCGVTCEDSDHLMSGNTYNLAKDINIQDTIMHVNASLCMKHFRFIKKECRSFLEHIVQEFEELL